MISEVALERRRNGAEVGDDPGSEGESGEYGDLEEELSPQVASRDVAIRHDSPATGLTSEERKSVWKEFVPEDILHLQNKEEKEMEKLARKMGIPKPKRGNLRIGVWLNKMEAFYAMMLPFVGMKPEEIFAIVARNPALQKKWGITPRTFPIELSQEGEDLRDELNEIRDALRKKSRSDLKECIIQLGYFSETPLRSQRQREPPQEVLERFKRRAGTLQRPKHRLTPKGRWQKAIKGTIEKEKSKKRVRSFEEAKARREVDQTLDALLWDIHHEQLPRRSDKEVLAREFSRNENSSTQNASAKISSVTTSY